MSENCRRKVVEDSGHFRCEHCQKTFMSYRPTYMITAKVSDFTDSIYVNFAREHGAALMGKNQLFNFSFRHECWRIQRFQRVRNGGQSERLLWLAAFQNFQHYGEGKVWDFQRGESNEIFCCKSLSPQHSGRKSRAPTQTRDLQMPIFDWEPGCWYRLLRRDGSTTAFLIFRQSRVQLSS